MVYFVLSLRGTWSGHAAWSLSHLVLHGQGNGDCVIFALASRIRERLCRKDL